jgi:SAM-dependent methyltransferase
MVHDYFGPEVAARYDDESERFGAAWLEVETGFLADLAGPGGTALEFAIGTGRVALPLRARGIDVHGIELSEAMVEQMRAKPGGGDIPVTIGDIASARADGAFDVVYLVFNTIGNLASQEAQVACFANAAAHLRPGGCFVIETGVPGVRREDRFRIFDHSDEHLGIDEFDTATQLMYSHHYTRQDDGLYRRRSIPFRYAAPAEYDLMARFAGMRLRERWSDFQRTPFTTESEKHVSVWEKQG